LQGDPEVLIEPRVYRAAFVPAALALVLAMFSFESRPAPLPQGLAADVLFDGRLAAGAAAAIAERNPDRRAGGAGDRATAARVATTFARRGFVVQRDRFTHAGKDLVNVVARRAGRSRRVIAVVADRDASSVPDAPGSAADTAALLELARVFEGRPSKKTLVLASLDGSALGQVGAERFVGELGDPQLVDGVLVMSDLGAAHRRGATLVPWSNDSSRAGIGLQRTVANSLRQELDQPVGSTSAAGQLARLSFPIGIGAQGVFLERGYDSVRVSGSGELPPDGAGDVESIDEDRLGGLGRGTLRTVSALDEGGPPEHGPESYVIAVSQVIPGWVLALLAMALLAPALVAAIDAFARARRRREPVLPWLRWVALGTLPFVVGLALAELLAVAGATPDPPPAPVAPEENPLDVGAVAVLAGLGAAVAVAFMGLRRIGAATDARLRDASAPGAACATALALGGTVLVSWFVNPTTALVLVLAAHLWMLATLVASLPGRRARAVLVAGGLLPPLLVALYYMVRLSMDPLTGAWYLLLLVTGHGVGLITALVGCAMLGALAATVAIVRAQPDEPEEEAGGGPRVYGPGSYAGPGSLGGTESALRR
jgi:hypothetical protein